MPKIIHILALFLAAISASAQGTVHFHNRSLTDPATGLIYNAPITGATIGAFAQLYLFVGTGASATYTPIPGVQTFRDFPNQAYFPAGIVVEIPGVPPGTIGTRVVMRAWIGGPTYDSADARAQSNEIVLGALGGIPASGPPITPPNLDGLQTFQLFPEPSTLTLALLGAAILLFRRPIKTDR